jgi:hypothetical protein
MIRFYFQFSYRGPILKPCLRDESGYGPPACVAGRACATTRRRSRLHPPRSGTVGYCYRLFLSIELAPSHSPMSWHSFTDYLSCLRISAPSFFKPTWQKFYLSLFLFVHKLDALAGLQQVPLAAEDEWSPQAGCWSNGSPSGWRQEASPRYSRSPQAGFWSNGSPSGWRQEASPRYGRSPQAGFWSNGSPSGWRQEASPRCSRIPPAGADLTAVLQAGDRKHRPGIAGVLKPGADLTAVLRLETRSIALV